MHFHGKNWLYSHIPEGKFYYIANFFGGKFYYGKIIVIIRVCLCVCVGGATKGEKLLSDSNSEFHFIE